MNAITCDQDTVPPEEWERPDMRAALADRDITRTYRLLQKIGFSQQRIAALTGQSQPEVSAIIHGRKVMAYDVLLRIADGLGIPRAYMGLSSDGRGADSGDVCHRCAATIEKDIAQSEEDDPMYRREFIGAAAAVAVGANVPSFERWLPRPTDPPTDPWNDAAAPAVTRIGASDVARIRATTDQIRQLDLQLGGGASLDATIGYLRYASSLLGSRYTKETGRQLRIALADLYSLAGMALHDVGRHGEANKHFLQGLTLARDAEERALTAALLWAMGRVYLYQDHTTEALRLFQLAQMAAQDVGSHAELARLHMNEALAYALLGQRTQMADALARAEHERSLVVPNEEATTFHGAAQYDAMAQGDDAHYEVRAHWILSSDRDASTTAAIAAAERAINASSRLLAPAVADTRPARCRSLDQTMVAGSLLRSGERNAGIAAAHKAVDQVLSIRSVRSVEQLGHVAEAAKAWPRNRDAARLRRRIAAIGSS
jgi:transcriptional regulator with XRE-family HTH domain